MTDRRIPRRHLVVALLALLAGGCSASSAGEVRDQGAARSGPPLSVPARTVESGSAGLEDRVAPDAPQPAAAALYLVRFGRIEAVARPLGGDGRGRAGLDALLDGPTAAERSLEYRTAIPRGTEVNAFSVDGDTATVDLSADFATSDGTDGFDQERVFALAQVVYTVTDADAVTRVRLLVNGEPAGSALGSGLVDRPLDREFIGILLAQALDAAPRTTCVPAREVDESPPQAEPIVLGRVRMQGDRLIVRGRLGGGEARTFVTRVLHDGNELRHEIATGCSGTFRQELPVPVGVTGELVIEAYVPQRTGARDGLVRKRFVIPEEWYASAMAGAGEKTIATNRRAFHEYHVEDRFEAGLALVGTEVKSLRAGTVSLNEAWADVKDGQVVLRGCAIEPYAQGGSSNHDRVRPRGLLLHREEIRKIEKRVAERGFTLIPLRLYFKGGRVKIELALARGKDVGDKRQTIADRDAKREMERAVKERYR